MLYDESTESPEEALEELEEILEGDDPSLADPTDYTGESTGDPVDSPQAAREEAEAEAAEAELFAGGESTDTAISPRAQELRSNPTVQKVVNDIRSAHSADEIMALMAKDPTDVPFEFLEEAALDYQIVEGGDTAIGSPVDVASAVWAELHAGSQS